MNALKVRSCLIDGEAVACDGNGVAEFERLRRKREGRHVFLCAFDLLELDGKDLRSEPFEVRKSTLASLLRARHPGLQFNQHLTHPRRRRLPSRLRHGSRRHREQAPGLALSFRSHARLAKLKNPDAPAVKREEEEEWGR